MAKDSNPVIPYGRQEITEADIKAVVESLTSDFLTQGPRVEQFEKDFSAHVGAPYAVAVTNGTAALHLAVLALGIKPGQKVLCPSNSFVASTNCVLYAGGEVEFVDIDPVTYCIDLNLLEEKLKTTSNVAGIVAVDFAGLPVVAEKIKALADHYGVWLIEDACHAVGAEYPTSQGRLKTGNGRHADISVFSFHPVKHLTTAEGGMLTTASADLYKKLTKLRTHGITRDPQELTRKDGGWYYEMQDLGYNYRIPDVLCALGSSQLKRLPANIERRQEIARTYNEQLKGLPLQLPQVGEGQLHAYHLYVVLTEEREGLYKFLRENQIYSQIHYIPIHTQPYYRKRYGPISLPVTENYYRQTLSLPMFHSMTPEQQERVIEVMRAFFRR